MIDLNTTLEAYFELLPTSCKIISPGADSNDSGVQIDETEIDYKNPYFASIEHQYQSRMLRELHAMTGEKPDRINNLQVLNGNTEWEFAPSPILLLPIEGPVKIDLHEIVEITAEPSEAVILADIAPPEGSQSMSLGHRVTTLDSDDFYFLIGGNSSTFFNRWFSGIHF